MHFFRPAARLIAALILVLTGLIYGFTLPSTRWPPYDFLTRHIHLESTQSIPVKRFTPKPGLTAPPPLTGLTKPDAAADPSSDSTIDQLSALGYLDGYEPAAQHTGVTVWKKDLTAPGVNLVMSGHASEAALMEMDGRIIHRWKYRFADAFPDADVPADQFHTQSWRRVRVLDDGGILAIFNGHGMIRLDRNSNLIWALPEHCHHDLDVADDGTIHVLTQRETLDPSIHASKPILAEFITHVSPDGHVIRHIPLIEAFRGSPYEPILSKMPPHGDVLHANTLEIIRKTPTDPSSPFQPGRILTSFRHLDAIALIDLKTEKIVWLLTGMWRYQHEPSLLENGRILLFDNQGIKDRSRVIELDPLTQTIHWSYAGTKDHPLFSSTSGACHRLPNGNTMIIESNRGRAIEVTPEGAIVWEYVNPERAGKNKELTAVLFDVERIAAFTGPDRR